jgi:hypothetical protein
MDTRAISKSGKRRRYASSNVSFAAGVKPIFAKQKPTAGEQALYLACNVKTAMEALVAAGVVNSRPQTTLAKQAGQELVNNYGFKKLVVSDPYQAPVGAVLVYGASQAAGHVEIRTQNGFVSDFVSKTPSRRPLIGVFTKS